MTKNSGLVLLAPYLGALYDRLDLLEDGVFRGPAQRTAAVELLQYLAFGQGEFPEYELALNKIMCGIALSEPLPAALGVNDRAQKACDSLLGAVLQAWTPLRNSSVGTLREAFLQREGRLELGEDSWTLKIAAKPYDMLLDTVPWPFRMIKNRWMTTAVRVQWR